MLYPMYSDIFAVYCEGRKGVEVVSVSVVGVVSRETARVLMLGAHTSQPAESVRRSSAKRLS